MDKPKKKKNPAAVALGRKGGQNSRVNLSPEERAELARRAAAARWDKTQKEEGSQKKATGKKKATKPANG